MDECVYDVCVCVHDSVQAYQGQRSKLGDFPYCSPHCSLKQGLSLHIKAKLAVQGTSRICLPLPLNTRTKVRRSTLCHALFIHDADDLNSNIPALQRKNMINLHHSE